MTEVDVLDAARVEVTVYGPEPAEVDFTGCSDWRGPADLCLCETWRETCCEVCGEEIHDGDMVLNRQEWRPDDEESEWDTRHEACNASAGDRWTPTPRAPREPVAGPDPVPVDMTPPF